MLPSYYSSDDSISRSKVSTKMSCCPLRRWMTAIRRRAAGRIDRRLQAAAATQKKTSRIYLLHRAAPQATKDEQVVVTAVSRGGSVRRHVAHAAHRGLACGGVDGVMAHVIYMSVAS